MRQRKSAHTLALTHSRSADTAQPPLLIPALPVCVCVCVCVHQTEQVGWGRAVCTNVDYPSSPLVESEISIGRKSSCTLQLKHAAISGVHCLLHWLPDSALCFLTDVSTNGTWVDGKRAEKNQRLLVANGSEITLIRNNSERIAYHVYLYKRHATVGLLGGEQAVERNGPHHKYELGDTLGTGAFAVVRLCTLKETGDRYAMKVIEKKKFALNHGSKRTGVLMDEVRILQKLNHPHIIKIHDVYDTDKHLYLVLELVTGGDLFDKVIAQQGKGFTEARSYHIFAQMLEATSYLHSHNIVHRDLKPENILLSTPHSDDIKLSDFGLSRIVGEGSTMKTLCGTPQYLAPEVLNDQLSVRGYDKAVDMWSLGVILYVLLTGMAPFNENKNLIDEVKNGRYSFPALHWATKSKSSQLLIRGLLSLDPSKRWTVEQVRACEWMRTCGASVGVGGQAGLGSLAVGGKRKSGPMQRLSEGKRSKVEGSEEKEEALSNSQGSRRGRPVRQR